MESPQEFGLYFNSYAMESPEEVGQTLPVLSPGAMEVAMELDCSRCLQYSQSYWKLVPAVLLVPSWPLATQVEELFAFKPLIDRTQQHLSQELGWLPDVVHALVVFSYWQRASRLLCPVLSWIIFSGTFAWNNWEAPVALRLWFVFFPYTPASLHILWIILFSSFLPIWVLVNKSKSIVAGILDSGLN